MRLEVLTLQVTIGWMVLGAVFHLLCSRNNPLPQKSIAVVPTEMEEQAFIEPDKDKEQCGGFAAFRVIIC